MIVTRDLKAGTMLWGPWPLPEGAEIVGTVQREPGSVLIWGGALMRLSSGQYVEGHLKRVRSLHQGEIERGLEDA